mgnify:CR=1 FL=1
MKLCVDATIFTTIENDDDDDDNGRKNLSNAEKLFSSVFHTIYNIHIEEILNEKKE